MQKNTNAKVLKSAVVLTKCKCSDHCQGTTRNLFSQGHDARLVSRLLREVGEGRITPAEAVRELRQRGGTGNLQAKLENALANAMTRVAKAKKVEEPVLVTAKVGRWTYEGYVRADGFHYVDRKNDGKVAAHGKFTLI